jgi:hypothetical protein
MKLCDGRTEKTKEKKKRKKKKSLVVAGLAKGAALGGSTAGSHSTLVGKWVASPTQLKSWMQPPGPMWVGASLNRGRTTEAAETARGAHEWASAASLC